MRLRKHAPKPNPGSVEAIRKGCTCDPQRNGFGSGRSPHRRSGGIIPIGNALYMALRQSGTYRDTGRMAKRTNKQPLKLLRSRQEYATALDEIEGYFDKPPKRGTPAANRFDLLELIIDEYEKRHWPIEPPRPIDAIRFQMEMRGRTQAD